MPESIQNPRFQTLQFPGTPWHRWVWSLGINGGIVAALLAIPAAVERSVEAPVRASIVSLVAPVPTRVQPVTRTVTPPVKQVRHDTVQPPPRKSVEVKKAFLPPTPVAARKPVEIVSVEAPGMETPIRAVNPVPAVSLEAPKPIKVGGFGGPNGAHETVVSSKPSMVPTVGAFDAPTGPGTGKGSAGREKLVASAGFGSAGAGDGPASGGGQRGVVHAAGFGEYDQAAKPRDHRESARPVAPAETPVEITYKPKPAYTPEAREKKIEGEVLLEVEFGSDGQIHILKLLRGLGYGLDENARAAASQIRFRPGTRNGTPVDFTGTVHIYFELS
jgi:TonB family protein